MFIFDALYFANQFSCYLLFLISFRNFLISTIALESVSLTKYGHFLILVPFLIDFSLQFM